MSNKTYTIPPSTWDGWFDKLEVLDVPEQIMVVKDFCRALPSHRERDKFLKDPRTRAWISKNVTAINDSVKKLKSHGYK